jgi:hypothetical protein
MTERLHITFEEDLVPETVTWARETKNSGGIAAYYVGHALSQIIELSPDNYSDVIEMTEFLLDGAYLDKCLDQFSRKFLSELNAPKVTIDVSRSFLFSERELQDKTRTIVTPDVRLKTFRQLPKIQPLIDSNRLVIVGTTV